MMLQNMNFNVNPCENFYEFSCGNFQKNTRIPDDQSRVDTFDTLRERLAYNLADLLSTPVKQNDNKSIKKVKDLFNSCSDEETIDKIGEERLLNFIQNELFGWPILSEDSDYKFVSSLDKMKKMRLFDTHFIFDLMISPSPKFPSTSIIRLSQPYWFFNKELYNDPSTVSAYKSFMQKIIELFSPNNRDLKNDIEKIYNLEKDFGMKQIDENLRRNLVHKKFTLRELEIKLPKFEWKKYFNKIFKYSNNISIDFDEQILIDDWEYIEQAVDVYHDALKNRPKDLDNLMIWVFIKDRTTMLPKKFKDAKLEFDRITKGTISSLPRSLICSNFVLETMEFAVGRLYVENYFNNASKDAATEMILNIQNEFKNMLKQLDWMDSKSKQLAIDKANNIDIRIGFPEFSYNNTHMEDLYSQYSIEPNEFFINFMNILKADTIENLNKLRKTNNRSEWLIGPAIVNAFYSTPNNQICFPAGILQFPFYDVENPNYLNYGGIGSVIGHEITHGFDDRGRLYDKNGVFHEDESAGLWTNETVEKYKKKVECFVDQYNSYHSTQVNRTIDGLQTCGENIADNGGIKQSFRAYRKWAEEHGEESILPGLNFNQEQLFFINYAQVWCGKFRDQNLLSRIINGQHSPAEFRVIGPTSNLEEFSEVFSCKKGQKNNPAKKCSVW
ncbi:endothelin-converting enzyme 1-like isoform X1 [Brachionus plicatilis]|uniref:Endothelin-converting enzyme 1-like isoform X1 n=1 Tax=Brachionus plicatilis TaxID=10195 RepID=A0A3M7QD35_BRAPC|nr:endothelin-converting enzyme 1-like isoform X1 [Brachionus plicatilis]